MNSNTSLAAQSSLDAAAQIPNVVLQTHDGKLVRLYDDLIKGRIALINFFYTRCTGICALTTANLVKIQDAFGDRFGRAVVMLSVTVDPGNDTPQALAAYCRRYDRKPGWYFVTGTPRDIERLRTRFGLRDRDAPANTHTGLLVYGNADTGQWAATPALADSRSIVRNVTRLIDLAS